MGARQSGGRHRLESLRSTVVGRASSILVLICLGMATAGPVAPAPPPAPSCDEAPYDIDGDSLFEPLTDGLLLLRYLFGFRSGALIAGVVGQNCTRCTAPPIEEFIELALAGCAVCGDAVVDPGEECDSTDLSGESCETLGFSSGTLACATDCSFDVSACIVVECGDGAVGPGEECDTNNLDGESCDSLGFSGGSLVCGTDCSFDVSACIVAVCGDAVVDPGEDCDTNDLSGESCDSLGFSGGTLACATDCSFDVSACSIDNCGNGVIDSGELCDGSNLGGLSCVSFGFLGGTLGCLDCLPDVSNCEQ